MLRALALTFAFAVAAAACGDTSGETCAQFGAACPKGGTVKNCCQNDYTSCHLVASDGTDFECNLLDCSAADEMASAWCSAH